MFQDNIALTWLLMIFNVIFFILAFAGMIFASIAARDMATAKAARKDAEKLFNEYNELIRNRMGTSVVDRNVLEIHRQTKNELSNRTFLQ